MGRSTFSGPVESKNGFICGTGTTITNVTKGTVSVATTALAASTNLDISVTVTGAAAGDSIAFTPTNSAMETNMSILGAWVSAANTVKIRIRNTHASSALTGTTTNWTYVLTQG